MKINTEYIVTLTQKEAEALKIILGKLSDNIKKDMGLADKEVYTLSELYDSLPHIEDE